ncbi:uncharacterized protein MELLADRAFT_89491 [Melampsora larici-populina 98AG31]|uniref:CCHC-type domain-containing protein n=1 Tax=Melampsora larici-populina (strain 98AG31 / pathotype 3-4-7) TaxID=747676 RepID=F4RTJ5_MELLP|nr:uncharacterized protein MELLADRAFT_89491 [Melampsora larici-populina 98AG31]EGG04326.1 hypothetical protein MELLADRAFT_89491 [Melampsora larici-populina 98AG31]
MTREEAMLDEDSEDQGVSESHSKPEGVTKESDTPSTLSNPINGPSTSLILIATPQSSNPIPTTKLYKCSKCRQPGHRANKCPVNQSHSQPTDLFNATQPQPDDFFDATQPTDLFATQPTNDCEQGLFFQEESEHNKALLLFTEDSESQSGSDTENDEALCPFCDEEMPANPSDKLLSLRAELLAMPEITQGIGRSGSRSLPFAQTATFCGLHEAERHIIPKGISEGWPTSINFNGLAR